MPPELRTFHLSVVTIRNCPVYPDPAAGPVPVVTLMDPIPFGIAHHRGLFAADMNCLRVQAHMRGVSEHAAA